MTGATGRFRGGFPVPCAGSCCWACWLWSPLVLVAVGVVSVLSLRGYVTAMNDAEVAESLHAFTIVRPIPQRRTHVGA